MGEKRASSTRKRRKKRNDILQRLHDLQYETPVERVRQMEDEFGPYWYYLMDFDAKIPMELKLSERYIEWTKRKSQELQRL